MLVLIVLGRLTQLVECLLYTQKVAGSSPSPSMGSKKSRVNLPHFFPQPQSNKKGALIFWGSSTASTVSIWF